VQKERTMSDVFVLDSEHRQLTSVHSARALRLLRLLRLLPQRKAAVWRRHLFALIVKEGRSGLHAAPLRMQIDPGSRTTSLALVNGSIGQVVWAAELTHRGWQVKERLDQRRTCRRSQSWLSLSLQSRIQNALTWVARFLRNASIGAISREDGSSYVYSESGRSGASTMRPKARVSTPDVLMMDLPRLSASRRRKDR
jgi:hypothetical protein